MNIEECKAVILSQFRQVDAPIRTLVQSRWDSTVSATNGYSYFGNINLYATEFNLGFEVKIVDRNALIPRFNIQTYPLSPYLVIPQEDHYLDLSHRDFKKKKYTEEYVVCVGTTLEFRTRTFTLEVVDYQISIKPKADKCWFSFDVATGHFLNDVDLAIACGGLLKKVPNDGKREHYFKLQFTRATLNAFETAMAKAGLRESLKRTYRKLFSFSGGDVNKSNIVGLVYELKYVHNTIK